MHIRLIAVSDRQPRWVDEAFDEYVKRFPGQWRFRLQAVAAARRTGDDNAMRAVKVEGVKILKQLKPSETVVLLDETGMEFTSEGLARQLKNWQAAGSDLVFIIGGPDGVSDECARRADLRWSLSRLTLPHGLARVMLAEQLYRACTLLQGHPYHRG
ncbi:MAG TPA: 23S rRNA (pseudouridine(1915)-N(3))-methyltransferase RlmH [Woeseiaceae bacterium]